MHSWSNASRIRWAIFWKKLLFVKCTKLNDEKGTFDHEKLEKYQNRGKREVFSNRNGSRRLYNLLLALKWLVSRPKPEIGMGGNLSWKHRIGAILDSRSFDSLFRVHEKSVSRRRHRVYAALSLHYIIPLCSRARLFATSVPRTLGIDDSFGSCLRYRLTVARIFSLKFLLFSFLVLAESIVITIIIIIIKFYH